MKSNNYTKTLIFLWAMGVIATYSLVPAGVIKHNDNLSRLGVLGFVITLPLGLKFCPSFQKGNKNKKQPRIDSTTTKHR